ncbi:MAG: hypothetical protein FD123_4115, partial [Bacteroidetes bacterium]
LSGFDLSDVRVHYNSSQPAQLNALAYAQGGDIHVASGQEKHVPHEGWHVVQQRQGRVQPTTSVNNVAVNDNAGLETEADVMGSKAMQLKTTEFFPGNDLPGMKNTSPAQRQPVVQRALGFEFETGWKVWDYTPVRIWELGGRMGKAPDPAPLKKKDMVHNGAGFKVEADEAGGGEAELEFIIHPPVETDMRGKIDLYKRMYAATTLGDQLLRKGNEIKGAFRMNQATGVLGDQKFLIRPGDDVMGARPQVTAGIGLDKITQLGKSQGGVELPDLFRQTKTESTSLENSLQGTDISQLIHDDLKPMSEELRGLMTVIKSYLENGMRAVNYAKQLGDSFLLARTDFGGLFKLLSEDEQLFFRKNPELFVNYCLMASGFDDVGRAMEEPVLRGVWENPDDLMNSPLKKIGPTRGKWLHMITQGYDLLSSGHYKEFKDYYAGEKEEGLDKDLESMGELGGKTEEVDGRTDHKGGIFELRSAALLRQHGVIPMDQWVGFALQTHEYFQNLEGR